MNFLVILLVIFLILSPIITVIALNLFKRALDNSRLKNNKIESNTQQSRDILHLKSVPKNSTLSIDVNQKLETKDSKQEDLALMFESILEDRHKKEMTSKLRTDRRDSLMISTSRIVQNSTKATEIKDFNYEEPKEVTQIDYRNKYIIHKNK